MVSIPADFSQFIQTTFPEDGPQWLEQLPDLVSDCAHRWRLSIGKPFGNLSYNYVLQVTLEDGTPAVLKAGVPRPEIGREIAAMELYNGRGAAKLLAADAELGILLLEQLQPGSVLHQAVDDDQATRIAAQLMQTLWRPAPSTLPFRPLKQWTRALNRINEQTTPLPWILVDKAQKLFAELFTSTDREVVLHGDLHHENILKSGQQWLAIDPKGIVGDPYYEPAPFLYNPLKILYEDNAKQRLNRRIDILAETLNFDRTRLATYGFCQCILSAAWSIEDHHDWSYTIHCAELFDL